MAVGVRGPEALLSGVDDLDACYQFRLDYGLKQIERAPSGATFEALDGYVHAQVRLLRRGRIFRSIPAAARPASARAKR